MIITVIIFIFKATLRIQNRIWFFDDKQPHWILHWVAEIPTLPSNGWLNLQLKAKPSISLYIFISLPGCKLIIFEWVCVFTSENAGPVEKLSASCPQNTEVNHYPDDISVGMHFEAYDLFQHCKLLCQFHLFVFCKTYDLLTIWTC